MNTMFYKYAIEVERVHSITQAAENLFMAQPNLSKAIKEMEDTLGFAVFERTSKGVIPTDKGRLFLEYAHNIVRQLDKIEAIADMDQQSIQSFNLCMPRGSYISRAVTNFVAQLDHAQAMSINIQETNSIQTISHLVEGKFNLGIIRYQTLYEQYFQNYIAEKNLCVEMVWEFAYKVLMSKDHPLANSQSISRKKLSEYTEIVHGDTIIPYLGTEKGERLEEKTLKKRVYLYERANQFELLANIKTMYMWVSTIPQDMLDRYNLVQCDCDYAGNTYKDLLVYPKGYFLSELDKKFINSLYAAKNEVAFGV
ncbi:MAG: LysR family transcriptional regulator [Cellulosilyticaceae bacterium]